MPSSAGTSHRYKSVGCLRRPSSCGKWVDDGEPAITLRSARAFPSTASSHRCRRVTLAAESWGKRRIRVDVAVWARQRRMAKPCVPVKTPSESPPVCRAQRRGPLATDATQHQGPRSTFGFQLCCNVEAVPIQVPAARLRVLC